jgi:hypothetical protein
MARSRLAWVWSQVIRVIQEPLDRDVDQQPGLGRKRVRRLVIH